MKVLVAHWHARTREEAEQMVREKFVASVSAVDHGLEAVFRVQAEAFDLILCGMELPVVTGFEIVRTMRHYPANKYTPAIVLANVFDQRHINLAEQLKRCRMANVLTLTHEINSMAGHPRKQSYMNRPLFHAWHGPIPLFG